MTAKTNKRYDVFFCHPSQDRPKASIIAKFLKRVFNEALKRKYRVFYAPDDLSQIDRQTKEWKDGINRALKQCSCLIAYYTSHSLKSKWMHYEIGAMTSRNRPLFPVVTESVDLSNTVINEDTVANLVTTDKSDLKKWILSIHDVVYAARTKKSKQPTSTLDEERNLISLWFENFPSDSFISDIYEKLKEQTIYIVGSKPNNFKDEDWDGSLVAGLSRELLNLDFRLASSPSVKEVGFVVARECLEDPNNYKIAGLHRFESDLLKKSGIMDSKSLESIKIFRQRYLSEITAIIVIGGKKNTYSEIDVAMEYNIPVFALPCAGGCGAKIYELQNNAGQIPAGYPCNKDCGMPCPHIKEIAEFIKNRLRNFYGK